jgi:hypothetical protein
MGAFEAHLHPDRELACSRCGRSLLLGERYAPGQAGDVVCDLCRLGVQAPDAGRDPQPLGLRRLRRGVRRAGDAN